LDQIRGAFQIAGFDDAQHLQNSVELMRGDESAQTEAWAETRCGEVAVGRPEVLQAALRPASGSNKRLQCAERLGEIANR